MLRTISYLSVLVSIVLLTSVSCKDKDDKKPYCTENPGNCQSVLAAKDFFLFKQGSWWVYEEETSLERDSVYVYEYNNTDGYDFDMRVRSSHTGYDYHYYPSFVSNGACSQSGPVQGKCIFINRSKYQTGDYVGEGYCFFINYTEGASLGTFNVNFPNNMITVTGIADSYILNSLSFGKTIKINEQATVIESDQKTNHYYSQGVGLIRKELLDSNKVWNLVSYHIEP